MAEDTFGFDDAARSGEAEELNGQPFADDEVAAEDLEWPIGFIVVLVLAALYLGWRLIQLIGVVIDFLG